MAVQHSGKKPGHGPGQQNAPGDLQQEAEAPSVTTTEAETQAAAARAAAERANEEAASSSAIQTFEAADHRTPARVTSGGPADNTRSRGRSAASRASSEIIGFDPALRDFRRSTKGDKSNPFLGPSNPAAGQDSEEADLASGRHPQGAIRNLFATGQIFSDSEEEREYRHRQDFGDLSERLRISRERREREWLEKQAGLEQVRAHNSNRDQADHSNIPSEEPEDSGNGPANTQGAGGSNAPPAGGNAGQGPSNLPAGINLRQGREGGDPPSSPSDSSSSSSDEEGPREPDDPDRRRRRRRERRRRRRRNERTQNQIQAQFLLALQAIAEPKAKPSTLPKAELPALELDTPEAYTDFKRGFMTIMSSRSEWTNQERKSFLAERIRGKAAVLIHGLKFSVDDDTVTWESVLAKVEGAFLTRANSVQAEQAFRNATQQPHESIRVWASRLRDLHTRAFALRLKTEKERETDYELRMQFVTGLLSADLSRSLMVECDKAEDLETVAALAHSSYFMFQKRRAQRNINQITSAVSSLTTESKPKSAGDKGGGDRGCVLCGATRHSVYRCDKIAEMVFEAQQAAGLGVAPRFLEFQRRKAEWRQKSNRGPPKAKPAGGNPRNNGRSRRKPNASSSTPKPRPGASNSNSTSKPSGGVHSMDEAKKEDPASRTGCEAGDSFLDRIDLSGTSLN